MFSWIEIRFKLTFSLIYLALSCNKYTKTKYKIYKKYINTQIKILSLFSLTYRLLFYHFQCRLSAFNTHFHFIQSMESGRVKRDMLASSARQSVLVKPVLRNIKCNTATTTTSTSTTIIWACNTHKYIAKNIELNKNKIQNIYMHEIFLKNNFSKNQQISAHHVLWGAHQPALEPPLPHP